MILWHLARESSILLHLTPESGLELHILDSILEARVYQAVVLKLCYQQVVKE